MSSSPLNSALPRGLPRSASLLDRVLRALRAALASSTPSRARAAEDALAGLSAHLLKDIGAPCVRQREQHDGDFRSTIPGRWS